MEKGPGAPQTPEEQKIPKISKEEWQKYCKWPNFDDQEFIKWAGEKGIEFDKGLVAVEFNGERREMNTNKNDFGTMLEKDVA